MAVSKQDESKQDESFRKDYDKHFDIEAYQQYYSAIYEGEKFVLKKIHEVFNSAQVEGDRILEIGCGPIVHRFGPASKFCRFLTYSDFSEVNRNEIKRWLSSDNSEMKHRHLFKYLAEFEGFEDLENGAIIIEDRIKSKAVGVFKCDVHKPKPLEIEDTDFDIIYSGATLESACPDRFSYLRALKNISSLLKPGGYLIISGFTGCDFYVVGNIKFPCLNYDSEFTKASLIESGFEIVDLSVCDLTPAPEDFVEGQEAISNCTGVVFALAKKL